MEAATTSELACIFLVFLVRARENVNKHFRYITPSVLKKKSFLVDV